MRNLKDRFAGAFSMLLVMGILVPVTEARAIQVGLLDSPAEERDLVGEVRDGVARKVTWGNALGLGVGMEVASVAGRAQAWRYSQRAQIEEEKVVSLVGRPGSKVVAWRHRKDPVEALKRAASGSEADVAYIKAQELRESARTARGVARVFGRTAAGSLLGAGALYLTSEKDHHPAVNEKSVKELAKPDSAEGLEASSMRGSQGGRL